MKSFNRTVNNIKVIKTLSRRPETAATVDTYIGCIEIGYRSLDRAERLRAVYAAGGRKALVDFCLEKDAQGKTLSPHTRRDWTFQWANKIIKGYFCAPFLGEMTNEWGWKAKGVFCAMSDGSGVAFYKGVQHHV